MTETSQLQNLIDKSIRDLRRNHMKAVRTVAFLKKRINDLELSMSEDGPARTDADMEKLNSLIERLDGFIDSVISECARTRGNYERLKHGCKMESYEPIELNDLEALCQENEQLAKDLLCYLLGRSRRSSGI